jgi:hypothetical protein
VYREYERPSIEERRVDVWRLSCPVLFGRSRDLTACVGTSTVLRKMVNPANPKVFDI